MIIIMPVLVFGIIALIMGLILGIASKLFAVEKDERIELVLSKLPGANCGGCGYAGCGACAEAIVKGEAPVTACPGCGQENVDLISEIMGVEKGNARPRKAFVKCRGSIDNVNYKYYFDGTKSCRDVHNMNLGDKMCVFACLGYGDCVAKCNFNAISIENSLAKINHDKCVGCGVCVKECPRNVIELLDGEAAYYVKCSSRDKGVVVKEACGVGCIACRICEKNCPSQAIEILDNVAVINEEKCTSCGICYEKCPKKIIEKKTEN